MIKVPKKKGIDIHQPSTDVNRPPISAYIVTQAHIAKINKISFIFIMSTTPQFST